ncbi:MAG TPA: hypothetical protein VIG42_07600 [Solirubrobacteraceae bacterium]|jgi:hypothetical protein
MSADAPHDHAAAGATAQAGEEEMRAAYEAELNRITSTEMILQTAVSLLNIGGRRLGLTGPSESDAIAPGGESTTAEAGRDLEQVRDAIDGVRALMPILERRMPRDLGPLRDAVSQLQMAYARETQRAREAAPVPAHAPTGEPAKPAEKANPPVEGKKEPAAGPAEASGRLWVPGR